MLVIVKKIFQRGTMELNSEKLFQRGTVELCCEKFISEGHSGTV